MASKGIQHLIVNSPYAEPKHHWLYHRETLTFWQMESRALPKSVRFADGDSEGRYFLK